MKKPGHVFVTFKGNPTEFGYQFAGDLAKWEAHFVKVWREAGHAVRLG